MSFALYVYKKDYVIYDQPLTGGETAWSGPTLEDPRSPVSLNSSDYYLTYQRYLVDIIYNQSSFNTYFCYTVTRNELISSHIPWVCRDSTNARSLIILTTSRWNNTTWTVTVTGAYVGDWASVRGQSEALELDILMTNTGVCSSLDSQYIREPSNSPKLN